MLATPQLSPDAIRLMNAMAASGVTTKDAGTTAGSMLHGPGGLLGVPGLNKQIINATIMPRGVAGRIPVMKSTNTNELYPIFTGQLASTGAEPTAACADWPTVGSFKTCRQTFPFGQQGRGSQVLNVKYAGQLINRGEFRDNVLLGQPGGDVPTPGPINWQRAFQSEYEYKLAELFNGYARDYARNVYTGNAGTTAGSQGYQQFNGLDRQIQTNKRDAVTGVACAAVDSIVVDLNGTSINTAGGTVYAVLANIVNNLERLSEQLGMEVKWALTIRYGAWQVLTSIWPCIYATTGCPGNANGQIVRTSSLEEQTAFRDKIRAERTLPIEGKYYEVIVDDTITETVAAGGVVGTYQSDLYFLPLTINGQPSLFWEYFDMNAEAVAAANAMAPGNFFSTLDNGRFLFIRQSPTHSCVAVEIIERPRLILLTPFLAARLQNLRYTYSIHEREWDPASPYFVNGGLANSPQPYFYPNGGG
jgi:hypothetical protein